LRGVRHARSANIQVELRFILYKAHHRVLSPYEPRAGPCLPSG